MKRMHSDTIKWHSCDRCDHKTKDKRHLEKHIASVHLKLKPFKCDKCNQTFSQNSHLQGHISRIHKGHILEKRYQCDKCEFKASTNQVLTTHINGVHLGLRPFKCSACGQSFTQKGQRNTHYKRVHLKHKVSLISHNS